MTTTAFRPVWVMKRIREDPATIGSRQLSISRQWSTMRVVGWFCTHFVRCWIKLVDVLKFKFRASQVLSSDGTKMGAIRAFDGCFFYVVATVLSQNVARTHGTCTCVA